MNKLFTLFAFSVFALSVHAQHIICTPNDSTIVTGNVADEFDPYDVHIHVVLYQLFCLQHLQV